MTLEEFALWLDRQRPSAAQMEISPKYNDAVIRTLEWVAAEARKMAKENLRRE
jgi:hypothetical protein